MNTFDTHVNNRTNKDELSLPILAKILETMREAVMVIDPNTRVLISNSAAFRLFSKNDIPLEDKRISEVIRDLTLHQSFQNALENSVNEDLSLEIPGAGSLIFDVHVAPIEIDNINCAVGVFYDISKIERLEKVRQEFLSNISHELRTPLTSIMAFVETLEDGAIDDVQNNRKFLGTIRKNAERMHRLIGEILELSSIESGKIELEMVEVVLSPLVEQIFSVLSATSKGREIKLVNQVSSDVNVFCDANRLEQMLTNLIGNAIKFNQKGGSVIVRIESVRHFDVISIEDTGEGIPAGHLERVFERFYRIDRARNRDIGGTGLGLAIVKHLAKLHGGEVSVRSKPGKGAVFSISIPSKPL